MQIIHKTESGTIVQGDNIEVMEKIKENTVDSCISDFPYNLSFMGKKWDTSENFYDWCYKRAVGLYRIMKPGGYVCIFGHPKTNHRMKSAFEDAGFKIVEEIDWVYLTGLPKNQDIGKLFDKKAGKKRPLSDRQRPIGGKQGVYEGQGGNWGETENIPQTEESKTWNGWKTAGLKPAHEPITIFQKPLEGTYIQNINKYSCGGMNIDACRVPFSKGEGAKDLARSSQGFTAKSDIYHNNSEKYKISCEKGNDLGRFPPNVIMDEYIAEEFDEQTGISKSQASLRKNRKRNNENIYGNGKGIPQCDLYSPYSDSGGGSRMFPIIKYCTKVSPTERKLPNGERNPHVTLKPVELIKWLIKLVTPINGKTIDITAGSCTHAVSVEELNKNEGYNLKYIDIELMNTESEPYCDIGKMRVEEVV